MSEYQLFNFTNNSTTSAGSLAAFWNFGDTTTSNLFIPTHTYHYADSFNVKLVVNAGIGCADSTSKTVYVSPNIKAKFTAPVL